MASADTDEKEVESPPSTSLLRELIDEMSDKEQAELLSKVKRKFDKAVQARQSIEQQWYMNMAFYFGKQWVQWVASKTASATGTQVLYEPPAPRWRARLIANKIQPMVRNELTKLTKEEPQFYVIPSTSEESDVAAARAAESIAEYLLAENKFNAERRKATLWACMLGNGFFKTYYDTNRKDSSGTPGCVRIEAINPFHFYVPDLQQVEVQEQEYLFYATCRSEDFVKDFFGVDDVKSDVNAAAGTFEARLNNILNVKKDSKDHVYVREMWIKPCTKYPEGAIIWFCDSQLLGMVNIWPYNHGEYPFQKIDHIPVPGRFYALSSVEGVIPLQKEYNKTRSQIVEAKNRMSKPQLLAPKGSVDPRKITSEPGLVIEYTPGLGKPEPLALQGLPGYVIQEQDRILRDIDDLSGQYEITKGRTPPGVEAASAIAYLQEENDSRLHHTVSSIEEAVAEVGHQALSLVGQYWAEERLIKVVSRNGAYEAKKFKAADLKGNYDFRIEAGSMAPRSRAARQAFVTGLMDKGHIPISLGLRYLQMSETNRMWQDLQLDQRQAQRENDKMLNAQAAVANPLDPNIPVGEDGIPMYPQSPTEELMPLPINEFDNDDIHMLEHGNIMKTQEWEMAPEPQKSNVLQHYLMHKQRQTMMMMQQGAGMLPQGEPAGA
jgi:hypothetical protein